MDDDQVRAVAAPPPVQTLAFVVACSTAGALAVPLQAIASPVSAIVAGLIAFLGLRIWRWSRLMELMKTGALDPSARILQPAALLGLGLIVGLLLLGVIRLAIEPAVPAAGARMAAAGALPIWRRLLIIYVAAVGEEIVFRLLLLSVIAGLAMRLLRRTAWARNRSIVWVANGLAAYAFAAAHLPAWNAVGAMSLGLAFMVVTLNGLAGVVLGYVFVTRGIVAAMWVHAGADCAIQLIGPLT